MRTTPRRRVWFRPVVPPRPLRVAALAALAAAAGLAGCEKTTRDTDITPIRLSELRSLIERRDRGERELVVLIDPRPERRFEAARLPGARNVRLPQIDPKRDPDPTIERYDTIVVYGDDPASATARGMTKRLLAAGYRRVRLYAGGVKEWASRGYATEGTGAPDPAEFVGPPAPPTLGAPAPASGPR